MLSEAAEAKKCSFLNTESWGLRKEMERTVNMKIISTARHIKVIARCIKDLLTKKNSFEKYRSQETPSGTSSRKSGREYVISKDNQGKQKHLEEIIAAELFSSFTSALTVEEFGETAEQKYFTMRKLILSVRRWYRTP